MARTRPSISSAYTCSFEPNPPPTRGAITRSFDSGIPVPRVMATFTMCGIWEDDHRVNEPCAVLGWARTERASIAVGSCRWITYRSFTTTGASANTLSTSPLVSVQV